LRWGSFRRRLFGNRFFDDLADSAPIFRPLLWGNRSETTQDRRLNRSNLDNVADNLEANLISGLET
jgi:hypothetical protein